MLSYKRRSDGRITGTTHRNRVTTARAYDAASRLTGVGHSLPSGTLFGGESYTLDAVSRRTSRTFADGRGDVFGYDLTSQVTAALYATTGASQKANAGGWVPGTTWAYDKAGNRTNVNDAGQAIRYTANTLNQYTAINGKAPSHNRNGDLLNDGSTRSFTWSGRSEILSVTTQVAVGTTVKESFTYDGLQRRISRTDATGTTFFIHDGWNVIAEYRRVGTTNVLQRRYLWGEDLSGSLQGAGGVGGLIQAVDFTSGDAGSYHYHYDGNGNVVEITNVSATVVASYRYDAFGRTLVKAGSYADTNRYRFSTKPLELTSGLYDYGYRHYLPDLGRWVSRDPLGERGGLNLYGFVGNDPANHVDVLGRQSWTPNYQPPGGGSTDPATQAANDAISDFFKGTGDLNREYGSDHPWTAEMKNHEHMKTVRDEIRSKIQTYCGGQKSGIVGVAVPRSWTLNNQSILTNARIFLNDVLAGAGLTSSVHSTGSFRFQYTINSIDCGSCAAKVDMDARDALRLGSATRIPFTNTSFMNDNSTPNTRGNTINLHWYWNEEVSRKWPSLGSIAVGLAPCVRMPKGNVLHW